MYANDKHINLHRFATKKFCDVGTWTRQANDVLTVSFQALKPEMWHFWVL